VILSPGAKGFLPFMMTSPALKSTDIIHHFIGSTFHPDGLAIDDGIGKGFSGTLDDSAKGRPGNTHLAAGRFMGHVFQISKPNRFQFINSKTDLFQIKYWNTPWFKVVDFGIESNQSILFWSYHHTSIISKCSL
jgi:hypothetical protein